MLIEKRKQLLKSGFLSKLSTLFLKDFEVGNIMVQYFALCFVGKNKNFNKYF
jgi:hypothetical protein